MRDPVKSKEDKCKELGSERGGEEKEYSRAPRQRKEILERQVDDKKSQSVWEPNSVGIRKSGMSKEVKNYH